jgi:hypothetical protein
MYKLLKIVGYFSLYMNARKTKMLFIYLRRSQKPFQTFSGTLRDCVSVIFCIISLIEGTLTITYSSNSFSFSSSSFTATFVTKNKKKSFKFYFQTMQENGIGTSTETLYCTCFY